MKSRDPLRVPLTVAAVFAMLIAAGLAPAWAQDRADIKGSQIIGNRELPKVLYIVPWKKPLVGDQSGRPAVSVLDEALAPIDREVFRRELKYDPTTQARAPATPVATPTK